MIRPEPIGLVNTGLPLVVLVVVAFALPRLLIAADTRAHGDVAVGIGITVLGLLMLGVAIFAGGYAARGAEVGRAFAAAPFGTGLVFLRLSGLASLVWGPVLALVWLGQAQGVERRRGEDLARRDSG